MTETLRAPGAGFLRRAAAYLLDAIPLTLMVSMIYMAAVPEAQQAMMERRENFVDFKVHQLGIRHLTAVLLVLYGTVCEATLEGTIGKRLMGMRVHDIHGRRLGWTTALLRNSLKLLNGIVSAFSCLWALADRNGRAFHDNAAHTRVVLDHGPGAAPHREEPFPLWALASVVVVGIYTVLQQASLLRMAAEWLGT